MLDFEVNMIYDNTPKINRKLLSFAKIKDKVTKERQQEEEKDGPNKDSISAPSKFDVSNASFEENQLLEVSQHADRSGHSIEKANLKNQMFKRMAKVDKVNSQNKLFLKQSNNQM